MIKKELPFGGYEIFNDQGVPHCDDGPARVINTGRYTLISYFQNGLLHRDDGPAVIAGNGSLREWYQHGVRHRTDGPAVEYDDFEEFWDKSGWYINGVNMSVTDALKGEELTAYLLKNKRQIKLDSFKPVKSREKNGKNKSKK